MPVHKPGAAPQSSLRRASAPQDTSRSKCFTKTAMLACLHNAHPCSISDDVGRPKQGFTSTREGSCHEGVQLSGPKYCDGAGLASAHSLPVARAAQKGCAAQEAPRGHLDRLCLVVLALALSQQAALQAPAPVSQEGIKRHLSFVQQERGYMAICHALIDQST